jgi:hypothetical protein
VGEKRVAKERDRVEDLGVDGRITLKWFLKKRMGGCELDYYGSTHKWLVMNLQVP